MIAKKTGREAEGKALALGLLVLALVAACLLLTARPAHADTFRVNSMEDAWDNSSTDGECATDFFQPGTEPNCTLRAAIGEANFNDESDTIIFDPALSGTITLTLGQLDITADDAVVVFGHRLDIQGPGARTITVSGNDASRVFHINEFANVTISGLTISDGSADIAGGILNDGGTLTLRNTTVSGNTASQNSAGGINNNGTLELTDSTVSGNTASNSSGGIYNNGTLTLTNSTVSGNTATTGFGGGISNVIGAQLTNSTVSGNTADSGGGIHNFGTLTLTNSTVSGNTATSSGGPGTTPTGGGIDNSIGTVTLTNTVVARNTATSNPDAEGGFNSEGNNLIGDSTGATGFVDSDLLNTNPLLGPLQDNGGPTKTHALLPGSPAVDAGKNTACTLTDQRGVLRTDGDKNGTVICDMGAFERNDLTPPKVTTTTPTAGRKGVRRNANLTAIFSEKMDRATLTKSTFKLFKVNSNGSLTQVTNVTVGSTTDGLRAALNPFGTSAALLAANSRYRAVVNTEAKDRAGNRLDQNPAASGSQPMAWNFTTGSS